MGNSGERPSRDFPGFKYLCLRPGLGLSAPQASLGGAMSLFSALIRSHASACASTGSCPKPAGAGRAPAPSPRDRAGTWRVMPSILAPPRVPFLQLQRFPMPTASKSAASPGKGDGDRAAPQNNYTMRTARGLKGQSAWRGCTLLAAPCPTHWGWQRWEWAPPCPYTYILRPPPIGTGGAELLSAAARPARFLRLSMLILSDLM